MHTKQVVENLRLMANTIEELEIDNIINCELENDEMKCHLHHLTLTNAEATWSKRHASIYPWKKSFSYNNIHFYAIYSQEEYDKELSNDKI